MKRQEEEQIIRLPITFDEKQENGKKYPRLLKNNIDIVVLGDNWLSKRRSINGRSIEQKRLLFLIERDEKFSKRTALRQIAVDWRNHGGLN